MAQEKSKGLTREALGTGVLDLREFKKFSTDKGVPVPVYEDPDLRLLVWNLEPGQENPVHVHPSFAQTLIVLEGSGVVLKGDNVEPVPIKAGQLLVAPRGVPHGIRNTGIQRLAYLSVWNNTPEGYQRQPA